MEQDRRDGMTDEDLMPIDQVFLLGLKFEAERRNFDHVKRLLEVESQL